MKLLVFADLHLKHGSPYDREPGDRLEDQVKVGQRIVEIARERSCGLMVNGGDTLDGATVQTEAYAAFHRIFGDCEIPIVAVVGNNTHDAGRRKVKAPEIAALMSGMDVAVTPTIFERAGVAVACLPSCSISHLVAVRGGGDRAALNQEASDHLISAARGLREDCRRMYPDLPAILLGHWSVEGGVTATGVEALTFAEPILPLADIDAMQWAASFFGHVHKPQNLTDHSNPTVQEPWSPIVIPGSPLPLSFGEAGDHGVWIFDTETGAAEFVPIESRAFVAWDTPYPPELNEDLTENLLDQFDAAELEGAIVKLRYSATAEQAKRIDHRKLRDALYAAGASKVYAIEATVERETRARVEISDKLGELEALDLFLAAQEIEGPTAAAARERIARYLEALPGHDAAGGASWKPLRLRASNFRSFETLDVTFPDGLFSIVGTVKDATAIDSNGAGKSSIILGVDLCLFGAESRSLAPYLSRSAAGDLMLELTFECGGNRYRVRRGFSANGRGKATCDFEEGIEGVEWRPRTRETIKETDALICQTIGMTRDTYRNSVYLAQGARSIADPNVDPQARRELFFGSLGLDVTWTAAMDMARADKRECEAQRQELTGRVGTLEETIAGKEIVDLRLNVALDVDEGAKKDVGAAEQAVTSAQAKVTEAEKDESRRREYAARLKSAEQTWQALEEIDGLANVSQVQLAEIEPMIAEKQLATKDIAALAAGVTRLEGERETLSAALRAAETAVRDRGERAKRIEQRKAEIVALTAKAGAAESAAGRVGTGEVATCQTCGQEIADAAAEKVRQGYLGEAAEAMAKAEALTLENGADELVDALDATVDAELAAIQARAEEGANQIKATRAALENARAAEVSLASLNAQAASYREHIAKAQVPGHDDAKQAAEVELQAARDAVSSIDTETPDLDALKRAAEAANYSLNVAQTTARDAHTEVVKAEAELERIAMAETQLAEHAIERELLADEHDLLCLCERACGKTGVPLFIVEHIAIPAVEEETDRVLQLLGAPYRIEWRTQRETKDGNLTDTLDLIVLDADGEAPYETFSGGEASRIVPAVMLGFARFLNEHRGADCRMLLVDELPYLDASGSGALVDLLRTLVESGQYESVGVVSHDPEVRDAFDTTIEITKDGNRSEVVSCDH